VTFVFPTLFWIGLPLVAMPAVIHFLNLRRQQRVPWAAMSFLLESQQKSKTWINLKELILLLLRTLAIALLVLLVGRPLLQSGWLNQWLGEPVHHIVLLDDSYSSSERFGDTSAWSQSREAVQTIIRRTSDQSQGNRLTVVRFSEAATMTGDMQPAIYRASLDAESREEILGRIEGWQPTARDDSLAAAIRVVSRLTSDTNQDRTVVHMVGDFRNRDLQPQDDVLGELSRIGETVEHLHLVASCRNSQPNLAIAELSVASGTLAPGVEVWCEVAVVNFGDVTARDVAVQIKQDDRPLPAVELGEIPPGETGRQRFRCRFADAGSHHLVAMLDDDAVSIDNMRWRAIDVPESQRVLLIDGSPEGWESYFIATALSPGGGTNTGWSTETVTPDRLSSIEKLTPYAAIGLLDVPQLDDAWLTRIESFVAEGGGLFLSLGESIDRKWYGERFYRAGEGLLPAPPVLPTQWVPADSPSNNATTAPVALPSDVQVIDHPALRVLAGGRDSFLPLLKVNYYYALPSDWQTSSSNDTQVIAKLASGAPLMMERRFGRGRVLAQYTRTASTPGTLGSWSNLSLNPAFPVLASESFAWLAEAAREDRAVSTGETISLQPRGDEFSGSGRLVGVSEQLAVDQTLAPIDGGESQLVVTPPLDDPGLYELQLQRLAGGNESQLWSVHVNVAEGDLRLPPDNLLKQKLAGANFSCEWADSLIGASATGAGKSLAESLLVALVLVLACEQVFAYLCSYHD
jgi:hypothetical protein